MVAIALFSAAAWLVPATTPALAQSFTYNRPHTRPKPPQPAAGSNGQMLVQATEVDYDYNNSQVSAVGNVQIFYNGTSLEADKVTYDQKTKRLHAEGNIRLTDVDGKITYANVLDLSDDYRDGFVDSLRVDTADQTRMAASRADRSKGNYTVFQNGVYTACAACRDNPKKPPLWQVKGARIIHDQTDKMLYFEDAALEFFGVPIAYLPYFSTPDPTVKRKSGFLVPGFLNTTELGYGVSIPFYWAIAPDMDATFSPRVMTRQGVLMQAEFQQRLIDGAYRIRAYGISQEDPGAFRGVGNRDLRGGIETKGQFAINDRWSWGWDGVALSDYAFLSDYRLAQYRDPMSSFLSLPTEAISQLYLTGVGNRSYFDARAIYYLSLSGRQSQVPVVAPVIDYSNVFNRPILGGEVSYKTNFTSLTRDAAAFDSLTNPVGPSLTNIGACLDATKVLQSADPAAGVRDACLLRGIPGTYSRLTAEAQWRRSFTDPIGQIWTPFASVRADAINASVGSQGMADLTTGNPYFGIAPGNINDVRLMPTVGFEYRYPFIAVQPWGTTIIEPIAQLIARPNEQYAGRLPNEDAQSMVFDTSNLFSVDKFSGYDRVEGGGRANVGVQATVQFDQGGSVKAMFGQSYHLFGLNSFAVADATNTALDSGLQKPMSDYVASIAYAPNRTYTFSSRARFDEATGDVQRLEVEGRANFDRWSFSLMYGDYAAQPDLGYLTRRSGVLGSGSIKLASNWVATGGARYNLESNSIDTYAVGFGYVDDCFILGVNYVTNYSYSSYTSNVTPQLSHAVMLQLGLRTLGQTSAGTTGLQ
ncbi:MAG: LPS-assembly protein LptD [Xanthobacteraceae bacterium]